MPKKKTEEPKAPKLTIALPPLVEPERPAHDGVDPSDSADDIRSFIAGPKKPVNKPDISGLPDGVVDGRPIFCKGDKIVIERRVGMFPDHPYLDTRAYHVNSVDMVTGRMELFDETLMQHARDNWIEGLKIGQVYKLTTNVRADVGKRKRGRPRKNPAAPAVAPAVPGEKKKRGRPAGSKNRSKDVIAEERRVKKAAKAAKVAAKKVKAKRK